MSPRLTKSETPAIESRDQAESVMESLARATHTRDSLQAKLDLALTEIRSKFEPQLTAYAQEIASHEETLEAWAKSNRATWGDSKSLELVHGVLSFRTGMPTLKLIGRMTWDRVLENLCLLKLTDYLRSTMAPDRERLIADADKLGEQLEAIGLRVTQREIFKVEAKQEKEVAA